MIVDENNQEDHPPLEQLSYSSPQVQQFEDKQNVVVNKNLREGRGGTLIHRFSDTFSCVNAEHKIELLDQKHFMVVREHSCMQPGTRSI